VGENYDSIQRNSKNLNFTALLPSADLLTLFVFDSPAPRLCQRTRFPNTFRLREATAGEEAMIRHSDFHPLHTHADIGTLSGIS
jgi:hypothetical protein